MPAKLITHRREYQPAAEREQAAHVVQRPLPEADEVEPVEPGRPYQAFVENEARKYWEDMVEQPGRPVKPDKLVKPDQQKLRAAAMPILLRALRNRGEVRFLPPTVKAHMAVNFMHEHAGDRGETKRPYKGPYLNPDYMEALIQYADDTRLSPQKIPLPWHEEPKHPPIYYYVDPITRQPTPMKDALIRAEYVRNPRNGKPITQASHIYPSVDQDGGPPPEVLEKKLDVYYRLRDTDVKVEIEICSVYWDGARPIFFNKWLADCKFTTRWSRAYEYEYHRARQRPHRDFVEREARKYWYEMVDFDSLAKPDPQEIRGAARQPLLEIRGWDRFFPPTSKAHRAVKAAHRRVEREIPLPEHGEPKHPPIYYYIDPITRQPTPREDALIRSDYVRDRRGSRITQAEHIHPSANPEGPDAEEMRVQGWDACYTLYEHWGTIMIFIHQANRLGNHILLFGNPLKFLHFSPHPPVAGAQET